MKPRDFLPFRYHSAIVRSLSSCLLMCCLPQAFAADTKTWDGGGGTSSWGTANNWNPDGLPAFNNGTDLIFNGSNTYMGSSRIIQNLTFSNAFDANGGIRFNNNGSSSNTPGDSTATNLTMQSGANGTNSTTVNITVGSGSAGNIDLGRSTALTGNLVLSDNLLVTHDGSGSLSITVPITGAFSVTKSGAGLMVLTRANLYSGATTLSAGTLSVSASSNLGAATSNLVFDGGTLRITGTGLNAFSTIGHAVSFNATKVVGLDISDAANTFNVDQVLNQTTGGFTKAGAGTVTLSQSNTYTGATTLSAGTLSIGTTANLGDAASNLVFDGGTLRITGTGLSAFSTIGHAVSFNATKNVGLDINNAANTFNVDQVLDQTTGGFTKAGAGTATLSQTNTYTGTTTVSAGSLIINGAVASTSVVVNGSLGGSGVMANATLSGSGSINPGNSPGILTGAATNPTAGLDFNFEFTAANVLPAWGSPAASTNDVLRLTAATPFVSALGGTNVVTIYLNVLSLAEGDVFTGGFYTDSTSSFLSSLSGGSFQYFLADAGGATTYGGNTYSAYTGPLGFSLATVPQSADFGAGTVDGYTTQFTAVPEPNVAALIGGLGCVLLLRRRR